MPVFNEYMLVFNSFKLKMMVEKADVLVGVLFSNFLVFFVK